MGGQDLIGRSHISGWSILGLALLLTVIALCSDDSDAQSVPLPRSASLDDQVMQTTTFHFTSPETVTVSVRYDIYRANMTDTPFGASYAAGELRDLAEMDSESDVLIVLKNRIWDWSRDLGNGLFDGEYYQISMGYSGWDLSSLDPGLDQGALGLPVSYNLTVEAELPGSFYLKTSDQATWNESDAFGLLRAVTVQGGYVETDMVCPVPPGHLVNLTILEGPGTPGTLGDWLFSPPEDPMALEDRVTLLFDNRGGNGTSEEVVTFFIRSSSPHIPPDPSSAEPDIQLDLVLGMERLDHIDLEGSIMRMFWCPTTEVNLSLPSNFHMEDGTLLSNGAIHFINSGIVDPGDLERELEDRIAHLSGDLADVFDCPQIPTLEVSLSVPSGLDAADLFGETYVPQPLLATVNSGSDIPVGLYRDMDPEVVIGFLNAGAVVFLDTNIDQTIPGLSLTLIPPPGLILLQVNDNNPLSPDSDMMYLASETAPQHVSGLAQLDVDVDFDDLRVEDLTVFSTRIAVRGYGEVHSHRLTDSLTRNLPGSIIIDVVNADALRLAYREGLIDREDITYDVETTLANFIGQTFSTDGDLVIELDDDSWEFDGDMTNMSDHDPVKIGFQLKGEKRFSTNQKITRGLAAQTVSFPLPALRNWDVSYTFTLPNHVFIEGEPRLDGTGVRHSTPETGIDNGRSWVSVQLFGDENITRNATLEITLDVSAGFILQKFAPPLLIFSILCLVTVVVYRKRRKLEIEAEDYAKLLNNTRPSDRLAFAYYSQEDEEDMRSDGIDDVMYRDRGQPRGTTDGTERRRKAKRRSGKGRSGKGRSGNERPKRGKGATSKEKGTRIRGRAKSASRSGERLKMPVEELEIEWEG